MQTFKPQFWALAAIILLSACNGTNKKTDEKAVADTKASHPVNPGKLRGTWEVKRVEGEDLLYEGMLYTFKDDSVIVDNGGLSAHETLEAFNDTSFVTQMGELRETLSKYHFKGDSLVVNTTGATYDAKPTVLYFVKK